MAKLAREKFDEPPVTKKLAQTTTSGRGRKPATTNGKEPATHVPETNGTSTEHTNRQNTRPASSPWMTAPLEVLHTYRAAHRLKVPAAYNNPHAHYILSDGIGKYSPTMLRTKQQRRIPKEQLALAVRKHFNALAVNENDAVVHTLYKARTNQKSLRLKFPATKPK